MFKSKVLKNILKFLILVLVIIAISVAMILFLLRKRGVQKQSPIPQVTVVSPKQMAINNSLFYQGYIESCVMSPVISYVQGRVLGITKEAGDTVVKDEVVAHLEPQGYADVKASASGIVLKRFVNVGDMVREGTPVALVAQPDDLCVYINVPEKNVLDVKIGQEAIITHKNTGKTVKGQVSVIEPLIDVKSKSFRVKILLNTTDEDLSWAYVGSAVSIEVVIDKNSNAYAVPLSCLSSSSLLYYVKDGVVCVYKGDYLSNENYIDVGKDYKNELFIIRGQSKVFPSQKVDTVLAEGTINE